MTPFPKKKTKKRPEAQLERLRDGRLRRRRVRGRGAQRQILEQKEHDPLDVQQPAGLRSTHGQQNQPDRPDPETGQAGQGQRAEARTQEEEEEDL